MKYLVIIYALASFIKTYAQTPVKLSSDQFKFTEGPVWDGNNIIYFTDIPNSKVIAYYLEENKFTEAFDETNRGNGLILSKDNKILMCEGGSGKITKRDPNGKILKTLISKYKGRRFNSPNDLCMDNKGQIYFTDPTWGEQYQSSNNVYFINSKKKITVVDKFKDNKPNGVITSPKGEYLYVNDSNSTTIYRYKINPNTGETSTRIDFATLTQDDPTKNSGADGMAMDTNGNLYVTAEKTVQIFNSNGKLVKLIPFPEKATNCTFGGKEKNILFVTAGKNLYQIKDIEAIGI